jgi:glutathione S-transferase
MLKLFYAPGACSLASHIALEEAGADYEVVRLDLKAGDQTKPEYLKVNPKGRVPVLVTDRGTLTESPAILSYIAQTHPQAGLAPTDDPFAFAELQAFNVFLTSSVHVAFAHAFRPGRFADGDAAAEAMRAKVPEALDDLFGLVEDKLSDGRAWVHGDRYTVSDPYLYIFTRWYQRDGMGHPDRYPRLQAHFARVAQRQAVKKVLADEGV